MPVTSQKSSQVTNVDAGTQLSSLDHGKVEYMPFSFTQSGAGDQNSLADLVYLPAGRLRVLPGASYLSYPTLANCAVGIGHTGYDQPDGTAVAADATAFASAQAVATAGKAALNGAAYVDLWSAEPILVQMKFTGSGGVANGGAYAGYIAFIRG
jgi:hypothetical protein